MKKPAQASERRQQIDATAARVYRYIAAYDAEFGYAPSMQEISAACFMARSTVGRYMDVLVMWGCLAREPGVARGYTILGPLPPHIGTAEEDDQP